MKSQKSNTVCSHLVASLSLSRSSHRRPPRVLRDPASVDEDAHDGDSESQHRQQCRSHGLQNDPVGDVLPRRFHDHGTGHHSERATDRDDGGERSDEQELRSVLRDRWKQSQPPDCDPSRGTAAAAVARVFHEPVEDRSLLRGWAPISRLHRAWRASRPPELSSSLRWNLEGFQGATDCPSESQLLALNLAGSDLATIVSAPGFGLSIRLGRPRAGGRSPFVPRRRALVRPETPDQCLMERRHLGNLGNLGTGSIFFSVDFQNWFGGSRTGCARLSRSRTGRGSARSHV